MTFSIADYVNEPSQTFKLTNLPSYVKPTTEASPIDEFRVSLLENLRAGNESALRNSDLLGRLLLIGIISASENYFRSIIAGVVNICPIAQAEAADCPVTLGAVSWHIGTRYSRSALEHSSLADAKKLKSTFKDTLAIQLPDADFAIPLAEYEKVCQLRHGIVHNDGFVPGKNAIKLEIPRMTQAARIVIQYEQLQDVAAVVNGLVRLLNRHIFITLCRRWSTEWRRRSDWNAANEEIIFGKLWDLCLSRKERELRHGRSGITKKSCMMKVKQEYGL